MTALGAGHSLAGTRRKGIGMWAQLIKARLKPGTELGAVAKLLESYEQQGSGLIRELFMQDQKDPDTAYILAVFESEEKAREREADPRRAEGQQKLKELLGELLAGPPEFVDFTVTSELVF
jgi:DNA-binding transcriptional MerR regulator